MTWIAPAAFAGLLALAVPILVHLFGRRQARPQRFPSLRLLREVRPTPATRSRPSDAWLLAVRCAVIVAAVAALAQPRWTTGDRAAAARVPVRLIVVDTSASMGGLASDGRMRREDAREAARRLLDSARNGMIVEAVRPGASMAGAASWLAGRSGLRELVIVSDFRGEALHEGDLAAVPPGIGVRLVRAGSADPSPDTSIVLEDGVRVGIGARITEATWPAVSRPSGSSVEVLAADDERLVVAAMGAAVRATSPASPGPRTAVIAFPRYAGRDALVQRLSPAGRAWQADLALALRRDPVLASVSRGADAVAGCAAPGVPVAWNASGASIASVGGTVGADTLAVFSCAAPGSLAAVSLLAALGTTLQPARDLGELDPSVVPDQQLRRWERPATEVAPRGREESSPDGRWLWVLALLLLGVEEWLRRRAPQRRATSNREGMDARAA